MALPVKLQARVLSWLGENQVPSSIPEPPEAPRDETGEDERQEAINSNYCPSLSLSPMDLFSLNDIAAAAGSPCVVVKDGFLGRDHALRAHEAAMEVYNGGEMRPAGMGRGGGLWHGSESRGDSILWVTDGIRGEGQLPEALKKLLRCLNALKSPLNGGGGGGNQPSVAGLGLMRTTSVQLARYHGDGRGYVRHRDTPKDAENSDEAERKITALYYLNPNWEASMGGQLRIHIGPDTAEGGSPKGGEVGARKWDVEPLLDRLVLFRSDLVDHEVLPAFAPRMAVTLWFYSRQVGLPSVPSALKPLAARALASSRPSPQGHLVPGYDTRDKVRPLPKPDGNGVHAAEASIFVSVVSYRDSEANPTIVDLFARASNASRVSVGLVWQLDLDTPNDEAMYRATPCGEELWGGRVRSLLMPAADAAGPSWARRVAQSLWKGEKYVLQIDSHTRFRPGWDSYLIRTLQRCPSFKPVLTTYPVGYELPHKIPAGETRPTLLVPDSFGPEGMLRQTGRLLLRTARDPLPSPLWASGFSFSGSALLFEVPYDPYLRHAFFGEEISMAARMFTRGWDFFAPPQTVVYHLWSRKHRPSFRQVSTKAAELEEAGAKHRLCKLLGVVIPTSIPVEEGSEAEEPWGRKSDEYSAFVGTPFGLGSARTLQSFADRLGVDFRTATVKSSDARNAGRPPTDFNDSVASGLEGVLGILRAETGSSTNGLVPAVGNVTPSSDGVA